MDTPASLEVLFCDLCSTSVPVQDVERGVAMLHLGKTIGACCLPVVRGNAPASTDPALGGGVVAVARPSSGGDVRLLPLGIVLLGAVAAASLFLDYRIGQMQLRLETDYGHLAGSLKSQSEVVQSVSLALDRVAMRTDVDRLDSQVKALDANQQSSTQRLQTIGEDLVAAAASVQAVQQAVVRAEKARPDHGPALAEIQVKLQQQAVTLAEILARPRSAAEPVTPPELPKPAVPANDLPPQLAHMVTRLGDADDGARFEAVDELLRSTDVRVLPHVLLMTKDADTFVRRLSVEGLKDFKTPDVVDALIIALADPEVIVRDSAWRSLKEVTGQTLPFEAAATSKDVRVRAQQKWQEWWDKNRATFGS